MLHGVRTSHRVWRCQVIGHNITTLRTLYTLQEQVTSYLRARYAMSGTDLAHGVSQEYALVEDENGREKQINKVYSLDLRF